MTDEMAEEVLRGLDEEIEREERDGEGGGWDLEGFLRRLEGGGVGGGGVKGEEGAKGGRLGVGSRLMQPTRASAAKAVPASAPATATALGQERRRPGSAKGSVGRTGLKGGVIGGFPRKAHGSASGVRSGVVGRRPVSSSSGGKLDVLRDA